MNITVKDKQDLLSSLNIENRALKCLKFLNVEYEKLALKNDIQSKVRNDLDQQQREELSSATNENNTGGTWRKLISRRYSRTN